MVGQINPQDLAVCNPNFVLEYFRLSADKRLLFGGRCNYWGRDPDIIKKNLWPRMLKIYPQLADKKIDFAWGDTIGVPINRVPQLGRISSNVLYCQGYSGHGISTANFAGKVIAEAIAGTAGRFDVFASLPVHTFPGGTLLRYPGMVLGMLYYSLKDKL